MIRFTGITGVHTSSAGAVSNSQRPACWRVDYRETTGIYITLCLITQFLLVQDFSHIMPELLLCHFVAMCLPLSSLIASVISHSMYIFTLSMLLKYQRLKEHYRS